MSFVTATLPQNMVKFLKNIKGSYLIYSYKRILRQNFNTVCLCFNHCIEILKATCLSNGFFIVKLTKSQ